jgi:hypothetical protein
MDDEKQISTILTIIVIFSSFLVPEVQGQSFDFGELETKEEQNTATNLLKDKEVLWRGDVDVRQFETGFPNDQLVVFYTTGTNLHWKQGSSIDFSSPDHSEELPGKVLYLDWARLPERPGQSLITTTFMAQNQFKTRLYLYEPNDQESTLTRIAQRNWELVRVVGSQLLSQEYDPSEIWGSPVFTLTIEDGSYQKDDPYPLPDDVRLMSLRKLSDDQLIHIGRHGNLELLDGKETVAQLDGQYGATPEILKPLRENWRRTDRQEPIRLPPEVISDGDRLAVSFNPPQSSGLQGLLTGGGGSSSIEIIRLEDQSLVPESSIGSFENPVLDFEIPPANPNQLLWLRRSDSGTIVLEMVELNEE